MKTKKTQSNPQSSDLRLQTTGAKLLAELKPESLHSHGDKPRHHKPSDTNVRTQLGLDFQQFKDIPELQNIDSLRNVTFSNRGFVPGSS